MYQHLMPTKCAEEAVREIQTILHDGLPIDKEEDVLQLIRRLTFQIYERCAETAEDYTTFHDLEGKLSGDEVGDKIAERIREFADERKKVQTRAGVA